MTKKKVCHWLLVLAVILCGVLAMVEIPPHITARSEAKDLLTASLGESAAADRDLLRTVTHDLAHLKRADFPLTAQELELGDDGSVVYYEPVLEDLTERFTIHRRANGDIVINIWEDARNVHDEVICTWYGGLYVDGHRV